MWITANRKYLSLEALGHIMEPEPGNPMEMEGVLNPFAGNLVGVERLGIALEPKAETPSAIFGWDNGTFKGASA